MNQKEANNAASADAFQNSYFVRGYISCRIKNGLDPIPQLLPATEEYRKWMAGWNSGLVELGLLNANNKVTEESQS